VRHWLRGAIALILSAASSLFAASGASAQPLGLGTSPQSTLTYSIGAAVSKVLGEAGHIQSRVQPSSGTGAMIPLVNSGEIDMGFCNTLELYQSFHGVGTFDKRPNPKLRAVGVIFPIKVGLFVRADSPIKSVKDMKGKTVSYGYTSQEIIKLTVDAMLATEGLTVADLKPVLVPNLIRGVDEFMSGRVDVTTFAIGSAKVSEADAAVGGIRYVPISNTPEALAAMRKVFRTAYIAKVDPAPNLAGVKEPINTMFYAYTVFANADLPAARVKEITRLIAENKASLTQSQPLFSGMDVQRLYTDIGVPYHEGAIAYYREKGIKEIQ
jgi:TRAP transporter TAXI family solute receptor